MISPVLIKWGRGRQVRREAGRGVQCFIRDRGGGGEGGDVSYDHWRGMREETYLWSLRGEGHTGEREGHVLSIMKEVASYEPSITGALITGFACAGVSGNISSSTFLRIFYFTSIIYTCARGRISLLLSLRPLQVVWSVISFLII